MISTKTLKTNFRTQNENLDRLVMEHAAVFINYCDVFQKASPKDEDSLEIVNFQTMSDRNYAHQKWVKFTYHNKLSD